MSLEEPTATQPTAAQPTAAQPSGKQPRVEPEPEIFVAAAEVPPELPFPVVGIGASAGGLEAVTDFLAELRPDSAMAYVFIQHLPPTAETKLVEILGRRTAITVLHVEDGLAIEPNRLYVIRPDHTLTMSNGKFVLGERLASPMHHHPVDDFFKSLATEQRERAIAIVMSGLGSNGTAGARAIKAVGGLCVAQSPETTSFPSMPQHLIDAGYADFVLSPREMPAALLEYSGHPYTKGGQDETAYLAKRDDQYLRDILAVLRSRTQQDFNGYKKPTVLRRIQRRMGLNRVTRLSDYARLLRQTLSEVSALADDLLIHVTGFFRDPSSWEALRHTIIVPLIASRETDEPIRCWTAACSSGEEAYTLAMLLIEEAARTDKLLDIKVFATDMAERALQDARSGVYPGGIEAEITPERLERFFLKEDAMYRVRPELREHVIFATHNVLHDPPISRMDIISCRNLLIYLEPEMQQRILSVLHFGLRDGGTLFLGSSETVGGEDLFEPVDKRSRIFCRVGPSRYFTAGFPMPRTVAAGRPWTDGATLSRTPVPRLSSEQLTARALADYKARRASANGGDRKSGDDPAESERQTANPSFEAGSELLQLALQATNDELKAKHEEVISSNEELQSTNEELETSREEMQSLNEELNAVNAELRVEMEDHRAASNDLMSLLTSTDIAVLFLDPRLRIRRFTPSMRDLLDMIATDVGRPLTDLARKFTDPELERDAHTVLERLTPIEREIAANDGRHYLRRVLPYRTLDNRIDGVVVTFVDISDRRRIEQELAAVKEKAERVERLQRMMNIAVVGVIIFDRSGTLIDANDAFLRMTGYTREDVVRKSMTWRTIIPPEYIETSDRPLGAFAEIGQIAPYEREFVRKDGTHSWMIFAGAGLGDGTIIEYCIDVSDRKRTEDELYASKLAAEEANRMKDEFLAVLSHELRTPLSAILLWVKMLQDRLTPDNKRLSEGLSAIKSNADAQQELINDLLDVSRITSGQLRLEMRQVDLPPIVRAAVDDIAPTAEAKGVNLKADLLSSAIIVRADAARLRQIVWNLLTNAVKFTPARGHVEVSLHRVNGEIEIRVSDTGRGIPPDLLPHVFERFRQADLSTTRTEGGMGLGLTIVKQLVELHGGSVVAESAGAGRGARFSVRLPIAQVVPRNPPLAG